jgi:hypothetical protein
MSTECIINVVCGFYKKMSNGGLDPSSKTIFRGIKIVNFDNMEKAKEEIEKLYAANDIKIIERREENVNKD